MKGETQQTQKGQSVWVFVFLHLEIRQSITPSSLLQYMNDTMPKASIARSEHITADCMCGRLECEQTTTPYLQGKLNNHASIMHTACHCCICNSEGTVSLGVCFSSPEIRQSITPSSLSKMTCSTLIIMILILYSATLHSSDNASLHCPAYTDSSCRGIKILLTTMPRSEGNVIKYGSNEMDSYSARWYLATAVAKSFPFVCKARPARPAA